MQIKITDYIKLLRPSHYIKNLFVYIPAFFGGAMTNRANILAATITFVAFCFVCSSVYCLNDIMDAEADKAHPVKRNRPLASGRIGKKSAFWLMSACLVLGIAIMLLSGNLETLWILLIYYVLNVAYCLKLKELAIVDVCIISFGFALRLIAGGAATGVVLSQWIVLVSFMLTLFLAFAKRRDDVVMMNETGLAPRRNTSRYNLTFINQAITITGAVMIMCYIMYTVSPEVTARLGTDKLYLTSILVAVEVLRYIQIAVVDGKGGDPIKIVTKDRVTQVILLAWIAVYLIIIYI